MPRHSKWTGAFERFKLANPGGVRVEIEAAGVDALGRLLGLCQERGVRVLLVYSPEFAGDEEMTSNRAEIFARFEEFRARFGATLWDYSNSGISLARTNFYNSQHLNARGAGLFTSDLASRLVALLGLKSGPAAPGMP